MVVNAYMDSYSGIYDIRMHPQNTACVLSNQTHNTKREASCMLCLSPFDDESICRSVCPTGPCLIMSECCKLHFDPCCDIQNIYQQTQTQLTILC